MSQDFMTSQVKMEESGPHGRTRLVVWAMTSWQAKTKWRSQVLLTGQAGKMCKIFNFMISQNKIEEFVPNDRTRLVRTMVKSTSRFKCRDGQFYWQTNYDILGVMADRLLTASSQMSLVPVRSYLWSILNCQDIIVFAICGQRPLKTHDSLCLISLCKWDGMTEYVGYTALFCGRQVVAKGRQVSWQTSFVSWSSLCWQDRKE